MIRYLSGEEKQSCRALWEEAFPEDSKSFDDYYFAEVLRDNRILVREEDGRMVSMLHRNPYTVRVKSDSFAIDYIVGVATAADCRHRGYMKSLLERMTADMYRERMPFCFLMPADERIYLPFGFRYIFDQPKFVWKTGQSLNRRTPDGLFRAADWINKWLGARYEVYAERSPEYMKRLLREIQSENGSVYEVYKDGQLVGYDSEWGLDKREQRFCYGTEDTVEAAGTKPAIMARIVCLPEFLKEICLDTGESLVIPLNLRDEMISENDGRWLWHIERETSHIERCREELWKETLQNGTAPLALSMAELTQWLFGYQIPEAAKEYAGRVRTLQGVFLDEVV